jgi:hypothetical protein
MILRPFTPEYDQYKERVRRWAEARRKPPEKKPCPGCKTPMDPIFSGGGLHIGYRCSPCGYDGWGRGYCTDGTTPAPHGLNPCGIIEESWDWQIAQRKKAGLNG